MKYAGIRLSGIIIAGIVLLSGCLSETEMEPDGTNITSPPTSTVPPGESTSINESGTVEFIYLEGGFYGIISDSGEHYDPINLNKEFQVDGLRVSFEAKVRKDMASIRMWGTIIEINRIVVDIPVRNVSS